MTVGALSSQTGASVMPLLKYESSEDSSAPRSVTAEPLTLPSCQTTEKPSRVQPPISPSASDATVYTQSAPSASAVIPS